MAVLTMDDLEAMFDGSLDAVSMAEITRYNFSSQPVNADIAAALLAHLLGRVKSREQARVDALEGAP